MRPRYAPSLIGCACLAVQASAGPVGAQRPAWMDREGIVMAGSWEAPAFRARLAGRMDFTLPPEAVPGYQREHSEEMVRELKALGVNFLMIHGYKGYGLQTERAGMEDAKRLADLAHKHGMRVGAYIGSTLGWESLFKEEPAAREWLWLDANGQPGFYSPGQTHRYRAMKNHPGYIAYIQRAVRFAVQEMKADLIHFDNTSQVATGWDPESLRQFAQFRRERGREPARPPVDERSAADPQLWRDWVEYRCEALAHYYEEMARFIRSLNPECAVECNPGGIGGGTRLLLSGTDHARLLSLGNAYWDESFGAQWADGVAKTHIRSLKVGQAFRNSTFLYADTAVDLAEMLAFNINCLGCVAWFQGGQIVSGHGGAKGPFRDELRPYIAFFHRHRDLYQNARPLADVGVVRDFHTMAFGPSEVRSRLVALEEALPRRRVPFAILFDQNRSEFHRYPALVAAPGFDLGHYQGRVFRIGEPDLEERLAAIARVKVEAPPSVYLELSEDANARRHLVHLVNYNSAEPATNVAVDLRLPERGKAVRVRLLRPEEESEREVRFEQTEGRVRFTVPEVKGYAVAVVHLQG